jgi:hypothetical protein
VKSINDRLDLLKQQIPVLIGETAPMNAVLMDLLYFLNAVYNRGFLNVNGYGNTIK